MKINYKIEGIEHIIEYEIKKDKIKVLYKNKAKTTFIGGLFTNPEILAKMLYLELLNEN